MADAEVDVDDVLVIEQAFAPGEPLVTEGDAADSVHIITSGRVRVTTATGVVLDEVGAGGLIGELSIVAGGARSATVTAVDDVTTAVMARTDFIDLLGANAHLEAAVTAEASRRIDERRVADFAQRLVGQGVHIPFGDLRRTLTWNRIGVGETLYRQGEPGDLAYVLVSGRIGLERATPDGPRTSEVGADQVFGLGEVLDASPRRHTATALRDSLVAGVSWAAATNLVTTYPQVVLPFLTGATAARRRAKQANRRTIAIDVQTDDGGLVDGLVAQLERFGKVASLSSERVDSLLGKPGVANAASGEAGAARLAQLLHEHELTHDHLVLEVDRRWSRWSERATRQADRLVAVVSPDPAPDHLDEIGRFFAAGVPTAQRMLVVVHPHSATRPVGTTEWASAWSPDRVLHVTTGSRPDLERVGRFLAGRPNGLALSGGGARGFAHLGVYKALVELGFPIDMVGGSSMGAAMGVLVAQGHTPDQAERIAASAFSGILDYTLPVVSLVKGERIGAAITGALDGWSFEDLWRPFFCVSTNLTRATEVIHRSGALVPAVRASVSIPGVLPPVAHGDDLLVDGGVLNNLPADILRRDVEQGVVVAVDVAPPIGPRAKGDLATSVSGWEALRSVAGRGRPAYPGITAVLMRTMIAGSMRERSKMLERGDADLYLDLDLRGTSLLDFDEAESVARAGYDAAMPRLEAWLEGRS